MSEEEKYIDEQLDFDGGGMYSVSIFNLYHVEYCSRSSCFKIFKVNVVLFFKWLLGGWKKKE